MKLVAKLKTMRLTKELGKGYSTTRLRYIRRFFLLSIKCPSVTDKLSYTHYCEIMWLDIIDMINYYINISINQNLSVRQLREKIKSKEYERLPNKTIGIILCKEDNQLIIKYTSDERIIARKYELL